MTNRRNLSRRRLLTMGATLMPFARAADESPVERGAKPQDLGRVGAGEGPAWKAGDGLYFTGGNKISRRDLQGAAHIVRDPAGANGLLFDSAGRLIVCESRSRRITRTENDGTITVLADGYDGMRFNSPNDLTVDSKGRIYFSDPRYGSRDGMEMRDRQGQTVEGVYRIDAPGKVTRVLGREHVDRPNGVLVSVDGKSLYVADNNNNTEGGARKLWRFVLRDDGSADGASRSLVFNWGNGRGPDGLKTDGLGRLYVAGGRNQATSHESADRYKGGVYILTPKGELLDFVAIPVDEVTNCAFGGEDLRTLYITAGGTLWSIRVKTPGHVPYRTMNRA